MTRPPNWNLLRTGVLGALVAAICCFTPILGVVAGMLGVSWLVGGADVVLIPILLLCVGIVLYAIVRSKR